MYPFSVTTIANLEIQRQCSRQGCNSRTFFGRDPQLNAPVFIKVVPKHILSTGGYFREAQILYASQHPNVMEVRFAAETDNEIVFIMDICAKGSLQQLSEERHLTCREIIKYSLEFLNGLHFVHTKGFVHFDIKPSNILLGQNLSALLSDFGLAKNINNFGFAIPDALYESHRPPESFITQELTSLSDIYQAGVTIYRLCNGENDYVNQAKSHGDLFRAIRKGSFPDRNKYAPHIPSVLRRIVNRSIHVDPTKRFQTVLDLQNALSNIADTNALDWQFEVVAHNIFRWTKTGINHVICFETHIFGDHFQSICNKTNRVTNSSRRIADGCCSLMPIDRWQGYCSEKLETLN